MTTLSEIKTEIIRLLEDTILPASDPIEGTQTPADLLSFSVQAGMTAISQRVWKQSVLDLLPGDLVIDVPGTLLEVEAILDIKSATYAKRTLFSEGESTDTGFTFLDFPAGQITLSKEIGSEGGKLYYSAIWELPTGALDSDTLETPSRLRSALALYGASYCMLARASGSSNIRQFGTKVDSGVPTDIPQKMMSDAFIKSFEREMMRFPAMRKGSV